MRAGDALPPLEVEVTTTLVIKGAVASRDWQPQHHDHHWATKRAGTRDIFLNTPNQAGWIERYLTDWTGPRGRLGRLTFRMRRSVCAGDTMTFRGSVTDLTTDETGCMWATVDVQIEANDEVATVSTAKIAVPSSDDDDPWRRRGDDWRP